MIPTLLSFMGNSKNPWIIDADELKRVLQMIVDKVYPDVKDDRTVDTPMLLIVSTQWLSVIYQLA